MGDKIHIGSEYFDKNLEVFLLICFNLHGLHSTAYILCSQSLHFEDACTG